MRAIMEDLLSGWSVDEERLDLLAIPRGRTPLGKGMRFDSGDSASLGQTRLYGWCPSLASSSGSRHETGGGVCLHSCSPQRRCESSRLALLKYSPYFSPPKPQSRRTASARTRSTTGNRAVLHTPRIGAEKSLQKVSKLTRAQTAVCRPPIVTPPVCSALSGSAAELHLCKPPTPPSRSAGSDFFQSLARASFPCSKKKLVLPEMAGAVDGTPAGPTRCRGNLSVRDSGDTTRSTGSEEGQSSSRSSCRECSSGEIADEDSSLKLSILEWENACAMEVNITQKRALMASELRCLQDQIDETSNTIESLKTRHYALREKLRSFRALRSAVTKEERKSKELQLLAKQAKERMVRARLPQDLSRLTTDGIGADGPITMARLLEQRSALQKERSALKEAIRVATAEQGERAAALNGSRRSISPSPQRSSQCKELRKSITAMATKVQRQTQKTMQSELRADALMERVETLRGTVVQQEVRCQSDSPNQPQHTKGPGLPENGSSVGEPLESCFITGLVL